MKTKRWYVPAYLQIEVAADTKEEAVVRAEERARALEKMSPTLVVDVDGMMTLQKPD